MTYYVNIKNTIKSEHKIKFQLNDTYFYLLPSGALDMIFPFKTCLCHEGLLMAFRFFLLVVNSIYVISRRRLYYIDRKATL